MNASNYARILMFGSVVLCLVSTRSMIWMSARYEMTQRQIEAANCVDCPMSNALGSSHTNIADSYEHHVMFALSGSNTGGMFKEFEVSLKSVLLNAPRKGSMTIHILANDPAYNALENVFTNSMKLDPSNNQTGLMTPTSIHIKTYNVQEELPKWKATIESNTGKASNMTTLGAKSLYRHTIGTWFRLFAGDVLPEGVDNVLYLDTDVVVMANLGNIWTHLSLYNTPFSQPNKDTLFYWGKEQCAGFIVLRPSMQQQLWNVYSMVSEESIQSIFRWRPAVDDQFLLHAIQKEFPERVGTLSPAWDVSVSNGPWKKHAPLMYYHRTEGVGMLHFNGGGTASSAFFETKHTKHYEDPMWNLAKYYVDIPWSWVFFTMTSSIQTGDLSYPLQIYYERNSKTVAIK